MHIREIALPFDRAFSSLVYRRARPLHEVSLRVTEVRSSSLLHLTLFDRIIRLLYHVLVDVAVIEPSSHEVRLINIINKCTFIHITLRRIVCLLCS